MNVGKRLIAGLTTVLGTVILLVGLMASPASAYPPGTAPTLAANASTVTQGSTLTLSGSGFNGTVSLVGHSASVDLGTAEANVDGTFTKTVTITAVDFPVGDHNIVASDSVGDSAAVYFRVEAAGSGGGVSNGDGSGNNGGTGNNGGGVSNGGSGSNGDGGGLAYTGIAVLSIGGLGVLLLTGGGIMLMAGRRRNATV